MCLDEGKMEELRDKLKHTMTVTVKAIWFSDGLQFIAVKFLLVI